MGQSVIAYAEQHGADVMVSDHAEGCHDIHWSLLGGEREMFPHFNPTELVKELTVEGGRLSTRSLDRLLAAVSPGLVELQLIGLEIEGDGSATPQLPADLRAFLVEGVGVASFEELLRPCLRIEEIHIRDIAVPGLCEALEHLRTLRSIVIESVTPTPAQRALRLQHCSHLEDVTIASPGLVDDSTLHSLVNAGADSLDSVSVRVDDVSDAALLEFRSRLPDVEVNVLTADDDRNPDMGG